MKIKKLNYIVLFIFSITIFSVSGFFLSHFKEKAVNNNVSGNDYSFQLVRYDKEHLSGQSDLIIEGQITKISQPKWNTINGENPTKEDFGDSLYKEVTVDVKEVLKGTNNQPNIVVYSFGGTDSYSVFDNTDVPQFTEGENVILFLSRDNTVYNKQKKDQYVITGLYQGKYIIDNNDTAKNKKENINKKELKQIIKNNLNTKFPSPPPNAVLEK